MMVTNYWGKWEWEVIMNGYRVSVLREELDGDDGCIAIRMYLMPLNCTLKSDLIFLKSTVLLNAVVVEWWPSNGEYVYIQTPCVCDLTWKKGHC